MRAARPSRNQHGERLRQPIYRQHFDVERPPRDVRSRRQRALETVLLRLEQALLAERDGPNLAREPDLAEHDQVGGDRLLAQRSTRWRARPQDRPPSRPLAVRRPRLQTRRCRRRPRRNACAEPRAAVRAAGHRGLAPAASASAPGCDRRAPAPRPARAACPRASRVSRYRPRGRRAAPRKIAEGFLTSRNPSSVMTKKPISLAAPNRFLTARTIRKRLPRSLSKIQHRIHHVLEHARPGEGPLLRHVTDE